MLTRVQATGKVTADSALAVALTFATPPTVGNAVVVPLSLYNTVTVPASCVDNRGNTYTLAKLDAALSPARAAIYYCPKITTSAAPFTITVTWSATGYFAATAIEVGGVGAGLVLDQTATSGATSGTTLTTGTTPALTAAEALLVAVCGINAAAAAIAVESVSPVWTQELEELSFSHAVGEADSRIVTGGLGAPASCSWTRPAGANAWTAVLAAFKSGALPTVERVDSFIWGPC